MKLQKAIGEDVFDDEDIVEVGEKGIKGFDSDDKIDTFVNIYVAVWANHNILCTAYSSTFSSSYPFGFFNARFVGKFQVKIVI